MALLDKLETHNKFSASVNKDDHYISFKRKWGSFYPLPRENQGVFLNWDLRDSLRISVLLPAAERTISAQWASLRGRKVLKNNITIKTPPLMFTTAFHRINIHSIMEAFRVFERNPEVTSSIQLRGYCLSNVSMNGEICFGNKNPRNLRQANVMFWNGPFNTDILPPSRESFPFWHVEGKCPKNAIIHDNSRCANNNPVNAHAHRHYIGLCNCRIRRTPNRRLPYHCDYCRNCIIEDSDQQNILLEKLRTIGQFCMCCSGLCECKCSCDCCSGICRCGCDCDTSEVYFDYLANYDNNSPVYSIPWENYTNRIIGDSRRKFMSYPENVSGVFITHDIRFLETLDSKYKIKEGKEEFALGIARPIDEETFVVMFSKDYVRPIKKDRMQLL